MPEVKHFQSDIPNAIIKQIIPAENFTKEDEYFYSVNLPDLCIQLLL